MLAVFTGFAIILIAVALLYSVYAVSGILISMLDIPEFKFRTPTVAILFTIICWIVGKIFLTLVS